MEESRQRFVSCGGGWVIQSMESCKQDTVEISCYSQSALCLAKTNVYHERTKHISRMMHFIRDIIAQGDVSVKKIYTFKNSPDILTKVVPTKKFEEAVNFCGNSKH